MITEMSRGKIRFTYNNDQYSAEGELLLPDDNTIEFVIYSGSIRNDSYHHDVSEVEKEEILESLRFEFKKKGRLLTVER